MLAGSAKCMRLKDRVSLVSGASRGIGRAIALTFAREGSDVVVNYAKNKDRANEVVDEITKMGRKAAALQADVGNKDEVSKMVNDATEKFGEIDILVNNAGIVTKTPILKADREEWIKVLDVNLLGTYYCIQAVTPGMIRRRRGKIINISSIGGIGTTTEGQSAYASSKAAVNILTKKLAYELGSYGINVNAIAPGVIKTELLTHSRDEKVLRNYIEEKAKMAALRRVGEPQEIANVALFLASDESSFITGQIIVVDGGRFEFLSHSP